MPLTAKGWGDLQNERRRSVVQAVRIRPDVALGALLLAACGGGPSASPEHAAGGAASTGTTQPPSGSGQSPGADKGEASADSASPGDGTSAGSKSASDKGKAKAESSVQIVAGERSELDGEPPSLKVVTPKHDQKLWSNIRLRLKLQNWELSEAPGKHVHVIVNNQPYIAVREISVSNPVDVHELYKEHFAPLEQGTHVLRVFPSRANHESVKQGTPFKALTFHYKSKSETDFDPDAPLLTYSRPKGCYPVGERVMLDFYVSNVHGLSKDGYKVKYTLDFEQEGTITKWAPHYIENLPEGDHTLDLELIDENGEYAGGPFNSATRTFRVSSDCDGKGKDKES
jgi:hypothetical protein